MSERKAYVDGMPDTWSWRGQQAEMMLETSIAQAPSGMLSLSFAARWSLRRSR